MHLVKTRANGVDFGSLGNQLFASFPRSAAEHLLPHVRRVELPLKAVLVEPGKPTKTVYFPEVGWASLLMALEDGVIAEVGLIGREGFVGLNALFDVGQDLVHTVVQATGVALAIDVDVLAKAMEAMPTLRALMVRYAMIFNTQVGLAAACNVSHPLMKRLVRWLLMSHDRADSDEFQMTHEFLALMLGVRRAGVSIAAAHLRAKGLIAYTQGSVRIVDRPGLEQVSCGCNRLMRREGERLLRRS